MTNEEIIKNHEERISALEKLIDDKKKKILNPKMTENKAAYSGPKGGALLLIDRGFFNVKKTTDDVQSNLEKEGYVYKRQVVQTALDRLCSKAGPLVRTEEGGKRTYVKRK